MLVFSLIFTILAAAPQDSVAVFSRPLSEAEILRIEADDQHAAYEFREAAESYRKAFELTADSLKRVELDSLAALSRTGAEMAEYCYRPKVAGRKRFPISQFLGHMPLSASQRARLSEAPVDTLMLPDSSRFAARYPIESDDYIYFSSRELHGIGGLDLYRCRRLAGGFVSEPENLGFPWSSPADDFLLVNTSDGQFTLFASNRGCTPDSVCLYALVREAVPVWEKVAEGAPLRELCVLEPVSVAPKTPSAEKALAAWRKAAADHSVAKDTLSRVTREVDAMRRRYSEVSGAEKQFLGAEISHMEMALPALRKKEAALAERLRAAEGECRRQGVEPGAEVPVWEF